MSANLTNMSPAANQAWERLLQSYGVDLNGRINSAYRDPEHNAKVGGAKKSQHIHGNAFDVNVADLDRPERLKMIEAARAAGFQGIGVYNNALHFDVGGNRAWGSDYTSKSLPDWAASAVGAPVGTAPAPQSAPQNVLAPQQAPQQQQGPQYRANYLRAEDFMTPTTQNQLLRFT